MSNARSKQPAIVPFARGAAPTLDEVQLLRPMEVAKVLGVSRTTVYDLLATDELPSVRIGRSVRVRVVDVHAFVLRRQGDR